MRGRCAVAVVLSVSFLELSARADRFDDYLKAQMHAFHLPGVSFAVVEDGKVARIGAYGLADVHRGTAATAETVYKIGSVSKQFIATGVMLLAQDGRIDIDGPVSRYLEGTPPTWKGITVRHLLTHTAGLVRESPGFDPAKAKADAEIITALYSVPLRYPPGSKWEYSNAGYYVLAEIVTRVSGQPWTAFLETRVFRPAGMQLTVPTNVRSSPAHRAAGYTGNDNRAAAPDWVALRPSGAFLSTVGDLAKWDALLDANQILTESSRRQMWTPVRLTDGTTYPYGFGWHTDALKDGRRVVWHGGGLPGFASYYARYLDDRVSVILFTNGDDVDLASLGRGLAEAHLTARKAERREFDPAAAVWHVRATDHFDVYYTQRVDLDSIAREAERAYARIGRDLRRQGPVNVPLLLLPTTRDLPHSERDAAVIVRASGAALDRDHLLLAVDPRDGREDRLAHELTHIFEFEGRTRRP